MKKLPLKIIIAIGLCLCLHQQLLAGPVALANLRCENQINPLGVDTMSPRLSWVLESKRSGVQQSAYRVLASSSMKRLAENQGDLWDSGKVASSQTLLIEYAGKPLTSHQQVFWKVFVSTSDGTDVESDVGTWSMGILSAEGWSGRWITRPTERRDAGMNMEDAAWIWRIPPGASAKNVPPGQCTLSRSFEIPRNAIVSRAELYVAADNSANVMLNGKSITKVTSWVEGRVVDIKEGLISGNNNLTIHAQNGGRTPNAAGVLCKVEIELADGKAIVLVSDNQWQATGDKGGETHAINATEVAPWGKGPWGSNIAFTGLETSLPIFRKRFSIDGQLTGARVNVSGLGHYELFLNGQKVGNHFLDPPWSVYEKTVYYNAHDITDLLKDGENEFRIMLGKGFYNVQGDRRVHRVFTKGRLMAILEARLEFADGRVEKVVTDESWDVADGPIMHSAILAGSDFDARAAEPVQWLKAMETDRAGTLRRSESPPMAQFERLSPVKSPDELGPENFVYDFGQNLSAIPSIKVRGEKGSVVRITPAEQRHGQTGRNNNGTGAVNQGGVGSPNYYEYTLNGKGQESWQPQFTYGGFQYLQITGAVPEGHSNPKGLPVVEELQLIHVRSSAERVGAFSCSNPLWVEIDTIIDRSVRSNLAHVLTDCPTREKLGWLEVSYLMGPSISRRYDLSRLYAKVTRDIRESQADNGAILTVAPNYPRFGSGFRYTPEWGAAGVILPWQLYRWYGDKRVIRENFQTMKAFVDFMEATGKDLIPHAGLGDWYDYGHGKGSGGAKFTSPELTAMATFYRCSLIVSKAAAVLGNTDDAQKYQALADDIRVKFEKTYYTGNGLYENNGSPQTANAMALVTGLCKPENEQAVLEAILDDLKERGYQQTAGDIGFHYLVEALSRFGRHDTISKIINRRDEGSYGFIIDRGWTSLPEAWDANTRASMNHCMLGHIQQWFYRELLGIRQAETSVAFREIIIKPAFEADAEWAKGFYDSASGRIRVDWTKKESLLSLSLGIPANTTATVFLPAKDGASVSESDKPVDQAKGVTFLGMRDGCAVFHVESGSYSFTSNYNQYEQQGIQ